MKNLSLEQRTVPSSIRHLSTDDSLKQGVIRELFGGISPRT